MILSFALYKRGKVEKNTKRALLVSQDKRIIEEIVKGFYKKDIKVVCIESVEKWMAQLEECEFYLVMVDYDSILSPDLTALRMMKYFHPVPVIIISANCSKENRCAFYHAGAHGCLKKPYDSREYITLAETLMQLYMNLTKDSKSKAILYIGKNLVIDNLMHKATWNGGDLHLTKKEFDLLSCLINHAGQVLSKEQLYEMVWHEPQAYQVDEVVKAHIKALRKKLSISKRTYIKNIWGVGYQFIPDDEKP